MILVQLSGNLTHLTLGKPRIKACHARIDQRMRKEGERMRKLERIPRLQAAFKRRKLSAQRCSIRVTMSATRGSFR